MLTLHCLVDATFSHGLIIKLQINQWLKEQYVFNFSMKHNQIFVSMSEK